MCKLYKNKICSDIELRSTFLSPGTLSFEELANTPNIKPLNNNHFSYSVESWQVANTLAKYYQAINFYCRPILFFDLTMLDFIPPLYVF